MAEATGLTFAKLKILVGDGGTPTEVFAALCGVTQKSISYNSDTVDSMMPDCANEDLPCYKSSQVSANQVTIACSGKWAKEAHGTVINWWKTGASKNVKVQYVEAAVGDPEYINGPAILINLEHSVEKGGKMDGSFELRFTSMPTFVNKA